MREIPSDFDELVQWYGAEILKAGSTDPEATACFLVMNGFLDRVASTEEAFLRQLNSAVSLHLRELEDREMIFVRPVTLPRDNEEMYRQYQKPVRQMVNKIIKFGLDTKDAEQEVWAKLIGADVLGKFTQGASLKRLPALMTTSEAVGYLGVSWDDWSDMLEKYAGAPTPARGDSLDEESEYRSLDIQVLDRSGYFQERRLPRVLPASATEAWKFESYLRTAADRHARNLIRTHVRRFTKDTPMTDANSFLVNQGQSYRATSRGGDQTGFRDSWEASLVDRSRPMEETLDARRVFRNLGAPSLPVVPANRNDDFSRDQEASMAFLVDSLGALDNMADSIGCSDCTEEKTAVVRLLSEGDSPREAKIKLLKMQRKSSSYSHA